MEKPGTAFNKLPIHGIFHTTSTVITTTDVLLQLYCTFLIIRVSTSNMSQYRRFLLFSTVCDVCYAATVGLAQPRHFGPEFPVACMPLTGPLRVLGDPGARAWVGACWFLAAAVMTSQYYALVYRVVVISDWRWLKDNFARTPFFALGVTICLTIALTLGFVQYNTVWPDRGVMGRLNGTELGFITEEDTAVYCVYTSPYMVKAIAATLLLFTTSEVFFLSCAAWIVWKVNKTSAFSERTRSMHLQLTRLLIAQMLSPVLCMLAPVTIILVNGLASVDFGVFSLYLAEVCFSVFPLVDALLTIAFVSPYRRFTVDLIRNTVKVSPIDFSTNAAPARSAER